MKSSSGPTLSKLDEKFVFLAEISDEITKQTLRQVGLNYDRQEHSTFVDHRPSARQIDEMATESEVV